MLQNGKHQILAASTMRGTIVMCCAKFVAMTKAVTKMSPIKRNWPLP